jgi:UDP-glucose 4-epimerase
MKLERVIVTGGLGFIGSHLVELLVESDREVIVLDNGSTGSFENLPPSCHQVEWIEVDLSVSGSWIDVFKPGDTIFHLAGLADIVPSIRNPDVYFNANVVGTQNVLEAARKSGSRKVVYAASASCYGIPDAYPTSESAEIRPQYPYALTKYLGELIVRHWTKVYDIPSVSLRLFNVFGPRSRTSGTYGAVFGVFLAQKLAGKPYTVVGDGRQSRDFTFVNDVARAFFEAGNNYELDGVFNIGTGKPQSINRLVELLGGDVINIPKRPGEPDQTCADSSLFTMLTGWEPEFTFEEGVQVVLDNIDYWRGAPIWTPELIDEATRDWFRFLDRRS